MIDLRKFWLRQRMAALLLGVCVTPLAWGTDYQIGWPIPSLSQQRFNVGNLDSDPELEIVFIGLGGIHVYNHDGTEDPPWPLALSLGAYLPALGDIDGDGELDIVYLQSGLVNAISASGVQKPGWPVAVDMVGSPARWLLKLGDIDGDGDDEVVVPGLPSSTQTSWWLHVIQGDGTALPGWPIELPVTLEPGQLLFTGDLAVGDVDFDGDCEIAYGTYIQDGPEIIPSPCFVFDGEGTVWPNWPVVPPFLNSWQQMLRPILADLTGDFSCEVFGSGFMNLHGYRLDGTPLFAPPATLYNSRNTVCGDLDGDGDLEIVVPGSRLKIFDHQGNLLAQTDTSNYWLHGGIALGDVNGDGVQEICTWSLRQGGYPTSGTLVNTVHLFDLSLQELPTWPKPLGPAPGGGLHPLGLIDLDGDNDLEVIVNTGYVLHVWDEPNPGGGAVSTEWPLIGHDAKRSGYYHLGNVPSRSFLPGDVDGDEQLDLGDAIVLLGHLFTEPVTTDCLAAMDFDGNGTVDLSDPVVLLGYLFLGQVPVMGEPTCHDFQPGDPLSCTRFSCP